MTPVPYPPRHLAPTLVPRPLPPVMHTPIRARKRPLEVEAIRWDSPHGTNAVLVFCGTRIENGIELLNFIPLGSPGPSLYVAANDAKVPITPGTWIIRDRLGLYPCHPDIFEETYEVI